MSIVSLVLQVKDQASKTVQKLNSALGTLGGQSTGPLNSGMAQATSGARNLVGQITQGVVQANALTGAFNLAAGAVGKVYGTISDGIGKSMELQLSNMTTASGFAAQTGVSAEKATEFIDRLNERLAISSATLPGNTAGYSSLARSITDNVIPAFKKLDGTMNMKGLEDTLASISESYGALAAGKGIDTSYVSQGLSKALSGGSISEMMQGLFFEQSPELINFFETKFKEMGVESFADLKIEDRVKLLQEAGEKFITSDFKKAASESATGLIEGFKSALFDPMTGLFGLSFDLDKETKGMQTAFNSYNAALKELIGSDGVFFRLGAVLKAAGVNLPHPMQVLKDGLDIVVAGLKRTNKILGYLQSFLDSGGSVLDALKLLPTWLNLTPQSIGKAARAGIEQLTEKFKSWLMRGSEFLSPLIAQASTALTEMIGQINFGSIAGNLGTRLISFFWTITGTVGKVFGTLATALPPIFNQAMQAITQFIRGVDWGELGIAAGAMVGNIIGSIIQFFGGLDYGAIVEATRAATWALLKFMASFIGSAALAMLPGIGSMLGNVMNGIKDAFGSFFDQVGAVTKSILSGLQQAVVGFLGKIGQFLGNIPGFNSVVMPGLNALGAAFAPTPSLAATSPITGPVLQTGGGRWNGNIPIANQGLISAAAEESRKMPTGAQVVVANDREFILQPTGRSASSGQNNFNIHIHGISDPRAIADAVVAEIQARFDSELQNQLA